jgi:NTE family protein
MKTGLVLSGGSIKGAFQAGAVREILNADVTPSGVYGISVGSLNGGFITDRAGRAELNGDEVNWPIIGDDLGRFWLEKIDNFKKIGRERSTLELVWQIARSKFEGLLSTSKLRRLVHDTLKEANIRDCSVIYKAGSVNMADGKLIMADNHTPNLIDYIIASTAIPVAMPVSWVDHQPLVDGGVRDVAALKPAIDDGAEEIICVLCQPRELTGVGIDVGDLKEFAERLMDIIINETVNNDIEWANYINDHCPEDGGVVMGGPMDGYRHIPITVIRPAGPLNIKLTKFSHNDIERIYEEGRSAARKQLEERARKLGLASPV